MSAGPPPAQRAGAGAGLGATPAEPAPGLSELYRIRFAEEDLPRKRAIWQVLCKDYLQRVVGDAETVVDVACGYGEFINNIVAPRKIAVDLNPDSKNLLDPDVEFHQCGATQLGSVVTNEADLVFTSNFLEHLPDKATLDEFLRQVRVALRPGGRYLILGPNLRYLAGEYWDFYDHHLGLTHLSLAEALQLSGFEVVRCVDRFLPYTTQGSLPTHPTLVRAYLKLPWAWRFIGKQFLIEARSPGSIAK